MHIKYVPKFLLIWIKLTAFYHQIFGRIELIIANPYSQREVEEESIDYLMIYIFYRLESRTSEIDSFRKINFMIKGIGKRRFECCVVKVISSEIEGLESFHFIC
ncbi:TPA: hypothetical protein DCZ39_05410 [Patescibacteria group bacterium]|nr:hypothetical protein [Candidatus Gracilibacteria bacterium]